MYVSSSLDLTWFLESIVDSVLFCCCLETENVAQFIKYIHLLYTLLLFHMGNELYSGDLGNTVSLEFYKEVNSSNEIAHSPHEVVFFSFIEQNKGGSLSNEITFRKNVKIAFIYTYVHANTRI